MNCGQIRQGLLSAALSMAKATLRERMRSKSIQLDSSWPHASIRQRNMTECLAHCVMLPLTTGVGWSWNAPLGKISARRSNTLLKSRDDRAGALGFGFLASDSMREHRLPTG